MDKFDADYDAMVTGDPFGGDIYIEETDEEDGFEWGWEDEEPPELIEEGPLYNQVITIEQYGGVAFFVDGYRSGKIECHMIGDDRTFTFDKDDVSNVLEESEFCWTCGQVGCGWE